MLAHFDDLKVICRCDLFGSFDLRVWAFAGLRLGLGGAGFGLALLCFAWVSC